MMHLVKPPKKKVINSLGLTLLGAILIVLKLTNSIDVSWWLVLLPFYIVPAIILFAVLLMLTVAIISGNPIQAKKVKD